MCKLHALPEYPYNTRKMQSFKYVDFVNSSDEKLTFLQRQCSFEHPPRPSSTPQFSGQA